MRWKKFLGGRELSAHDIVRAHWSGTGRRHAAGVNFYLPAVKTGIRVSSLVSTGIVDREIVRDRHFLKECRCQGTVGDIHTTGGHE